MVSVSLLRYLSNRNEFSILHLNQSHRSGHAVLLVPTSLAKIELLGSKGFHPYLWQLITNLRPCLLDGCLRSYIRPLNRLAEEGSRIIGAGGIGGYRIDTRI